MVHAIRLHRYGGPEVLTWEPIDLSAPGAGEIRVAHTTVGLNFIDIYHRSGLYPLPLPLIPGSEAAGIVEAVGSGVTRFKQGDRVAYAGPIGSYSQARLVKADQLVAIPDSVTDETAAAVMLQGLTARYLLLETYPVQRGETILMHAAAGGVGLLLCQWAKALGVTVIGTTSTPEKAALAMANGCAHALTETGSDLITRVKELTGGTGVAVVYDSIGAATFDVSLDCLAPRGTFVSFGNASGPVPPLDIGRLAQKGSLYLTRPRLGDYTATEAALTAAATDLFGRLGDGTLKVHIGQRYPLSEAAAAHQALADRKTVGSTVFTV